MDFTKKYSEHIDKLDSLKAKQIQLSKEMQLAYDYKEDLLGKMIFAEKQIKDKQHEYHNVLIQMQNEISKLKIEFARHVGELTVSV